MEDNKRQIIEITYILFIFVMTIILKRGNQTVFYIVEALAVAGFFIMLLIFRRAEKNKPFIVNFKKPDEELLDNLCLLYSAVAEEIAKRNRRNSLIILITFFFMLVTMFPVLLFTKGPLRFLPLWMMIIIIIPFIVLAMNSRYISQRVLSIKESGFRVAKVTVVKVFSRSPGRGSYHYYVKVKDEYDNMKNFRVTYKIYEYVRWHLDRPGYLIKHLNEDGICDEFDFLPQMSENEISNYMYQKF